MVKMSIRNHLLLTLLVLTLSTILSVKCEISDNFQISKSNNTRDSKMFISVSVPPDPCGEGNVGVCIPRNKCTKLQGVVVGLGSSCAQGFGECCTFTASCDATTTAVDVTKYVTTLKAPLSTSNRCSFRIKKQSKVCQVRLDFKTMTTNSADANGICRADRVTVRGSTTVADDFTTCGALGGQHMYLSYGNQDTIEVIVTHLQSSASSDYEIVATQIPCSSTRRVPDNCLQYYNTSTGVVRSFDFGPNGQQQSKQKYTICVKELSSSITWSPCSGANLMSTMLNPFDISTVNPLPGASTTCEKDWIQINGKNQMCNGPIPTTGITSEWGPYLLNVNFDETEQPPFPFMSAQAQAIDMTSCLAVQTAYPSLIDSCDFVMLPAPGICTCQASVAAVAIVGTPDIENRGFCLQYGQL